MKWGQRQPLNPQKGLTTPNPEKGTGRPFGLCANGLSNDSHFYIFTESIKRLKFQILQNEA